MANATFIRTTVGLLARHANLTSPKLVKIHAYRLDDGSVSLRSVSANNLAPIHAAKHVIVSADAWANSPADPYDDVAEARWALSRCGWSVGADAV